MDRNEDREILRKDGFAEKEVVQLNKSLAKKSSERERRQASRYPPPYGILFAGL